MTLRSALAALLAASALVLTTPLAPAAPMLYPTTRLADDVDDYHGVKIPDPYRWLEDDNSPETRTWVMAQNAATFAYLEKIPERPAIRERLEKLFDYERYGVPFRQGGRYFYTYNTGLQNQRVLMVAETLAAKPRPLLDVNQMARDGTVSLAGYSVSEDGKWLAYGLARAGSDWQDWHVRSVETGKDTEDVLQWVKFSGASWARDGSGFYYSRYDEPKAGARLTGLNEYQKLYFHRLGTPQYEDALIYQRQDHKDWGFHGHATEDGRYLVISVSQGTDPKNAVFLRDLRQPEGVVMELLPEFDAEYTYTANDGPLFYFSTDLDAPRGRLIALDCTKPGREGWREIIPQAEEPLKGLSLLSGRFFCSYLRDAHDVIKIYDQKGAEPAVWHSELKLPGLGSVDGFSGERDDLETFFYFTSFTVPGSVYRLDVPTLQTEVFREPKVGFDPSAYETRQVFYQSKDGTRIPMFITSKKGLVLDGSHPALLYGYGGFNISLTPSFSVMNLTWLERGGIYAMANLRGGGEYGIEWHNAGIKEKKQNVFDDFIAAAEYLVREKYTNSARLGIAGGSNGGLLVGAALTQRPDLFQAAIPSVGVLDMLRFHKFTIGWAWTSDYGSSEDPAGFKTLLAYSPLHHLQPGVRYPATLITTSDHDDRVVPAHSFKFAARLQACQAPDGPPTLIRIQTDAGHGGGTALKKTIEEATDKLSFLWDQTAR